jgi:DNA-binding NarL/FixJ family response regulator
MIRVLIAEDQPVIRKTLARLLRRESDMEVTGCVADGDEAIRAAHAYSPDVVLMDLKMPRVDGVAATRAILGENPSVRVIALTTFDTDDLVFEAILAGANAYLSKDAEEGEIVEAVRAAARGESRLSPCVAEKIIEEFRRIKAQQRLSAALDEHLLTERERHVLAGVAAGKGNREIARELKLAEGTVKNHVSTILSKLQLRSRTELAVKAVLGR